MFWVYYWIKSNFKEIELSLAIFCQKCDPTNTQDLRNNKIMPQLHSSQSSFAVSAAFLYIYIYKDAGHKMP